MYDKSKGVSGYKDIVERLERKYKDPNTKQGELKDIGHAVYEAKRMLKIAEREEYERDNKVSFYGSDDYVGAVAGDTSFYFGYEVTKCKKHKTQDACDNADCEEREWVFQVEKDKKVVFEMLASEIEYPQTDTIESKLIVGMAHYIKSLDTK